VCLLARHKVSAVGGYSTLAGFVEVGESLEDAVRREVAEEAGVSVGTVTYGTSQAWPFPSGLVLGFRATAASDTVTVDGEELLEARWFPGRNSPSTPRQAAAWAARTRSTGSCSAPGGKSDD
jgi:NAD+ diphosphatase